MTLRIFSQDLQLYLSSFEGTDDGFDEWASNHCRVCGKEVELDEGGLMPITKLETIEGTYPVLHASGYPVILCSPDCESEYICRHFDEYYQGNTERPGKLP